MALAPQRKSTLEIPERGRCRWLMGILGLEKAEMELALEIDRSTLLRWLADAEDRAALREVRFHRLLDLTRLARGAIRPENLQVWMRRPNPRLGGLTPARLVGDEKGLELISQALHAARYGNPL